MGAALELLKEKSKKKKPHDGDGAGGAVDTPPSDDKAGAEYSKVGDVVGDDDYDSDGAPDSAPGLPSDDDDHEVAASFDSLADHLGIPDEKRDGARAALKSYVKACMRDKGGDSSDE